MKKKVSINFYRDFLRPYDLPDLTVSNSEPINKIFELIVHQMKYFLWPGIVICLVLPWSPDLYAAHPALLAFLIAVNSFLYTGLFVVFLLARKLRVQLRSL